MGIAYLSACYLPITNSGSGTCPWETSLCAEAAVPPVMGEGRDAVHSSTVSATWQSQEGTKSRVMTAMAIIQWPVLLLGTIAVQDDHPGSLSRSRS